MAFTGWYDQAKADAALAARAGGAGALDERTLLGLLNPLSGITRGEDATYQVDASGSNGEGASGVMVDHFVPGTIQHSSGQLFNNIGDPTGQDPNGTYIQWKDNGGGGFEAPGGNSHDRMRPVYKLDAQGNATPVSPGKYYQLSGWNNVGQPILSGAATMAAAYFGGSALAGMGSGSGAGAGAAMNAAGATELGGGGAAFAGADVAAGSGAAAGAAGAGGGVAAGNGAFLGEGVASGVPAWDAAASSAASGASGGTSWYDSLMKGNYTDAAKAGGSSLANWVAKNPQQAIQLGTLAYGAASAAGERGPGESGGGAGSAYTPKDMPRGAWQSSVTPQYGQDMQAAQQTTQAAPQGLLANPQGQANDGLWRFNKKSSGLLG